MAKRCTGKKKGRKGRINQVVEGGHGGKATREMKEEKNLRGKKQVRGSTREGSWEERDKKTE